MADSSSPNPAAGATSQNPPQLDSVSQTQEMNFQASGSDSSVSQPNYAAAPPRVPAVLDLQPEQQELQKTPPDVPPPAGSAAAMDPPDVPLQVQAPSRAPALAPKSPSGPSAVWKKTQGENRTPPLCSGAAVWTTALVAPARLVRAWTPVPVALRAGPERPRKEIRAEIQDVLYV